MPRINMNDNVDRMFLDYLDRLDAADETYREWTQVRRGDLSDAERNAILWGRAETMLQLDSGAYYVMASLYRMNHDGPVMEYSDAFKDVVRNFAGIAVDAESGEERPMTPDEARTAKKNLITQYLDFLVNTRIDDLDELVVGDVERFFVINQAYRHVDALRRVYGDIYQEWLGSNPEKEGLLSMRMQQAEALGQQMQISVDAYYAERARNNGGYVINRFEQDFFGENYNGADTISALTEELSTQLAQKQSDRIAGRTVAAGVNLHLSPAFRGLADLTDEEITQVSNTERDLAEQMAEKILGLMTPEEVANGGVLQSGGTGQVMDKEDLIFINGQSLREYAREHLPANQRTDAWISQYSGVVLARAMQEGTNRISCAQVSRNRDGKYDVTMHPVRLDLKDCQPEIEDDLSYGYIHRKYFNWGPFKCKTRQEKANAAYNDPKLQRLEEGLAERLNEGISAGRENWLLHSTLDRLEKCFRDTAAYEETVRNTLGTENQDSDTRDLYSLANVLWADTLKLPEDRRDEAFTTQMKDMVTAFYSPNMEARKVYLDKMADFLDSFDPSRINRNDPEDMFRLGTFCRLSQAMQVKAEQYPEWFCGRYPTEVDRERYYMGIINASIQGAFWEKRGREIGRSTHFSGLWNMSEDGIESVKDFFGQIMDPNRPRTLSLKVPEGAAAYMNASLEELSTDFDIMDPMCHFMDALALASSPLPESQAIIGGYVKNTFYVDGVSLEDYANQISQGRRLNHEKLLLHLMADGGHHIDMVRLAPGEDGKWNLLTTPVRLDLSACEAIRADGMSNAEEADLLFRSDQDWEMRTSVIQNGLRESLTRGEELENTRRQNAGLPPFRMTDSYVRREIPHWWTAGGAQTGERQAAAQQGAAQQEPISQGPAQQGSAAQGPTQQGSAPQDTVQQAPAQQTQPRTRQRSNSTRIDFNTLINRDAAPEEGRPKAGRPRRNSLTPKPPTQINPPAKQ